MYCLENTAVFITAVAPFTGARVETFNKATIFFNYFVAPFTGARVETATKFSSITLEGGSLPSRERELKQLIIRWIMKQYLVAPFTGARVETTAGRKIKEYAECRSLHGSES